MKNSRSNNLVLSTSPFLHTDATTPRIMGDVLIAMVPLVLAAVWIFGIGVLLVVAAAVAGAVGAEWIFSRSQKQSPLTDNSALLTGVLLGLILPPGFPLWMALLGGAVGIGLGKLIWGGLGQNVFNPALVGRAFLQAAFPTAITTWNTPTQELMQISPRLFSMPLLQAPADATTAATPLGLAKFSGEMTAVLKMMFGNIGGSIGETSSLLIILAVIWLIARRACDWRLPVSTIGAVALFSSVIWLITGKENADPLFMIFSGGLLFGAVFMCTDPVTTPTTARGAWIFGAGVGFLVVLIRLYGGLPEGVMYAILLMNAVTPYINRYTQPRQFGGAKK
ncbi:MAG: RnfABCDGE type electron transport complex subunit D [Anaerolineales bacterium]|nr:RnfABCDGE type electron transport complex subunit D [Anaerolineales bacterium]